MGRGGGGSGAGKEVSKGADAHAELLTCMKERDRFARENEELREVLQARVDEVEALRCVMSPICV